MIATRTMEDALVDLMRREWVSPQTALAAVGCFSLAQRVSELKREKGLRIVDKWCTAGRSRYKSYHITEEIT